MRRGFKRPPTSQEAVLRELREGIAAGRMRPGQRIVQETLAASLGVSRVPLREALKILEGEGQVTYVPHHGYVVTRLSLSDLLEVYRMRELLETEAVTVAFSQMTTEDVHRFEAAEQDVLRASEITDIEAMTQANRRFHLALIEASGLPQLTRVIRQLWDATEVYRSVYFNTERNRDRVADEHRELVHAVEKRDLAAALDVLDRHRRHAIAALRPALEQDESLPRAPDAPS